MSGGGGGGSGGGAVFGGLNVQDAPMGGTGAGDARNTVDEEEEKKSPERLHADLIAELGVTEKQLIAEFRGRTGAGAPPVLDAELWPWPSSFGPDRSAVKLTMKDAVKVRW